MKRYRFLAGILFLCALSAAVLTSCKEDTDSLQGEAFTVSETVSTSEASATETEAVSENTDEDITPEPLSADAEEKLIADYAAFIGINSDNNWISMEDFYGTYNGCEAVIMYHGAGMTDDEKEIIVAGYTFWFSSGSYDFRLHKDSSFIDINTAYDEGYLTDEDIGRIYQNYLNSSNR